MANRKKRRKKRSSKASSEPKKIFYPTPKENICTECVSSLNVTYFTFITTKVENKLPCIYCKKETISNFLPYNRGYIRNMSR